MEIRDSIYGDFEVEPIFEKLINTKQVQRLKGVHQGGASYLVNPQWNVTRYEHSIGTMLFIRLMGGSVEEQISGLLHDISHTAFSHVIDFALDNKDEDYHEKIYNDIVETSDIPRILKSEGYNYEDILFNESKWTILEKAAPKLCADRIDYTLRDMYEYGVISKKEIDEFLHNLIVINGEVVVTSVESAEWFVDVYYKEVVGLFLNPLNIYAYDRLSKAIKIALDIREVNMNDLVEDDEYILSLLNKSKSKEIKKLIKSLNKDVKVVECKEKYDIFQKNKLRIIDPSIFIDGVVLKTSENSIKARLLTENAIKKSEEGVFVKVI